MGIGDQALGWVWTNRARFRWLLGCLAVVTVAESVLLAATGGAALIGLLIWGAIAYVVAIGQCGLWWAFQEATTARKLSGTVLLFCPAAAAALIIRYAASVQPAIGNVGAMMLIAAAASTEGIWRDLERDNPSISRPEADAGPSIDRQ